MQSKKGQQQVSNNAGQSHYSSLRGGGGANTLASHQNPYGFGSSSHGHLTYSSNNTTTTAGQISARQSSIISQQNHGGLLPKEVGIITTNRDNEIGSEVNGGNSSSQIQIQQQLLINANLQAAVAAKTAGQSSQASSGGYNSVGSNNYYYGSSGHQQPHHEGGHTSNLTTTTNKLTGSKMTSNAKAALQAYSNLKGVQTKTAAVGGGISSRKAAANDSTNHQQPYSSPAHQQSSNSSSSTGIVTQIQSQNTAGGKKSSTSNNSSSHGQINQSSNLNRYESLQNKLKNNRRVQPTNNLLSSNSQNISGGAKASQIGNQFNQTQKVSGIGLGVNQNAQSNNRKQLKLSVDQQSDTSFNNITIKSADKHNSVVRTALVANGFLTQKNQLNNTQTLNIKDILSNQMSPASHNGGSVIQNLASSQSSVYSGTFSNNSRFTNTRPKNPTDSSSLSSKNSDSLSSHGGSHIFKVMANQLAINEARKAAINQGPQKVLQTNKQSAIQVIRDQQQMLIQQHQQSDSMSDTGEGSFNSNEPKHQLLNSEGKPLISKLHTTTNNKVQDNKTGGVPQTTTVQIKTSSSISNLNKISQQIQVAANQVKQNNAYKSKFTLVSRPLDGQAKATQNIISGGDSYRRNSDANKKKVVQTSLIAKPTAPFSPKLHQTSVTLNSKITGVSTTTTQINQSSTGQQSLQFHPYNSSQPQNQTIQIPLTAQTANQRNVQLKAGLSGSIGGTKKSGRGDQNKTQDALLKPVLQTAAHHQHNYESNSNLVKPQLISPTSQNTKQQDLLSQGFQTAPPPAPQGKVNLDQLQTFLKQQQHLKTIMHVGSGDTIHEERCEDSEQNTKRESTQNNNNKQSAGGNLIQVSSQDFLMSQEGISGSIKQLQAALTSQASTGHIPLKSKSLLTINPVDNAESIKRFTDIQKQSMVVTSGENIISNEAPPPQQQSVSSQVEEIKSNTTLQALKEQLKSQIAKQHQPFSNPNQPSSSIEAEEIQYPITPRKALQLFQYHLTDYERQEIQEYNDIYFVGLNAAKIKGSTQLQHNCGYDDDRGDYQVVLNDHICYRYEVQEFLGKGSFGQALKCFDYKTNEFVAVKIIRNKKRFHHQAGVELHILNYLREHDPEDVNNIIRIKDYAIFRKHLVISFELLSINLYEFIKNNEFRGVSIGLIRRFAIQILQALKYQREHGIIHCDLKPENILLKQPNKSGIKIIDYGSSCFQDQRIYTYIQSRFYRAPEIILGIPYTTSIDMWSFGCILAELFTGFPLFPGENEMDQLAYIMEVKNIPEEYLLELASRKKLFYDNENQPIIVANSKGKKRKPNSKQLSNVLRCTDENFLDFIDKCLDWDPVNRMTPLEALQHDWILEGLPPKVLMHHQRMFGHQDDKSNIKFATLTPIQGFPPDHDQNTIFNQLKAKRTEALQKQKTQREEKKDAPIVNQDLSALSNTHDQSNKNLTIDQNVVQVQDTQASLKAASGSSTLQKKQPKTIQHLVQELFQEKAASQASNHAGQQPNAPQILQSNRDSSQENIHKRQISIQQQQQMHPQTEKIVSSKGQMTQNGGIQSSRKPDLTSVPAEDDIEEGLGNTQKIPISLIKQQEKLPIQSQHQIPFYNPKVSGPKLNNYISQAAAFNKKGQTQHSSTNNLTSGYGMGNISQRLPAGSVGNLMNHSVGQLTINSSMNKQQSQISNLNTSHNPYAGESQILMPSQSAVAISSRSGNKNTSGGSQGIIPLSMASITLQQHQQQQIQAAAAGKYKLTQAIKIDLNSTGPQELQNPQIIMQSVPSKPDLEAQPLKSYRKPSSDRHNK